MSLYVKIFINFWSHRKTIRLKAILGNDALWIMPRIWSYAAENQPDGDFSGYSDSEVALLIGYQGDASSMLQAMQQAGFMSKERKLHAWEEHNAYHSTFAKRSQKAAKARWKKERAKKNPEPLPPEGKPLSEPPKTPDKKGKDRIGDKHCIKHASSIDEDFIKSTRENPLFKGIDFEKEIIKMKIWLQRNPGRRFTKRFFLNWLGNAEREVSVPNIPFTPTGIFAAQNQAGVE